MTRNRSNAHPRHSTAAALAAIALALGLAAPHCLADFENEKIITDSPGLWQGTLELIDLKSDTFVFPGTRFWDVKVTMHGDDPFVSGELLVRAQHKHAPHGHGETNPGPDLFASLDVTIVPGIFGPATDVEPHFGHPDTLTMQLDARGFVPGRTNAVLAIQLEHPDATVPAPATLAGLGLAGGLLARRRRPTGR